jgi:hypothetical protein
MKRMPVKVKPGGGGGILSSKINILSSLQIKMISIYEKLPTSN